MLMHPVTKQFQNSIYMLTTLAEIISNSMQRKTEGKVLFCRRVSDSPDYMGCFCSGCWLLCAIIEGLDKCSKAFRTHTPATAVPPSRHTATNNYSVKILKMKQKGFFTFVKNFFALGRYGEVQCWASIIKI